MNTRKVQVLEETTVWDKSPNTPNHTYYLDAFTKKLIAYRNALTGEMKYFSGTGIRFERARRTFKVKWRYI